MGNWCDLPGDIINLIMSKLFGNDRFSLVCKSWNAAAATSPYHYSVPCLMYYHRPTHTWKFHRHNSSFFTSFPQQLNIKDAEIRCSKYGWLLMSRRDNTLLFLDPSNYRMLNVPGPKIGDGYTTVFFLNPPTSTDCTVVGIKTPIWNNCVEICMLRCGKDDEWQSFVSPMETEFMLSRGSPVLHHGLIYFLDVKGNVARFDIVNWRLVISDEGLRQQLELGDDEIKEHYLFKVEGEEGLFGVFVFHDERKVKVFRLSEMKPKKKTGRLAKLKWELVEDIGDNVFYLSHTSAFGCAAGTKTMANRIYFPKLHKHGDSVVFFSLSDGKYHSHNGNYSDNNAIGLKVFGHAAWVMPAPISASKLTTTQLRWFLN